jgi:hypothetical protein
MSDILVRTLDKKVVHPLDGEVVHTCSICADTYAGFGNNAFPFPGRCCNYCNGRVVIPARIARMKM